MPWTIVKESFRFWVSIARETQDILSQLQDCWSFLQNLDNWQPGTSLGEIQPC